MPVEQPFNVYREQLSSLYHGLALWKPCPEGLYDRVAIGDVGYISDGAFIRMFNVTLPWDDASNRTLGVPDRYDLLNSGEFTTRCENFGKLEYYSRHVSREENVNNTFAVIPDQTGGVTYKCKGRGALLFLPQGGHREDAIHMKVFEKYIRDHVSNWFNWSKDIGLPVERMEDIVLVYGCTMVTSWAAAAFDDYTDAQVSLTNSTHNNGGASFIWTNIRGTVEIHNSQLDPNGPARKNHCVFIKCFRAKRILFWTRHLRAAAEPLPDDPDNSQDGGIQVTQVPNVSSHSDPLIEILDYIVEKFEKNLHRGMQSPSNKAARVADMAIAHHDDLRLIKDVGILTADAVRQFLSENGMPLRFADGAMVLQHPLDGHDESDKRPGTNYGATCTSSTPAMMAHPIDLPSPQPDDDADRGNRFASMHGLDSAGPPSLRERAAGQPFRRGQNLLSSHQTVSPSPGRNNSPRVRPRAPIFNPGSFPGRSSFSATAPSLQTGLPGTNYGATSTSSTPAMMTRPINLPSPQPDDDADRVNRIASMHGLDSAGPPSLRERAAGQPSRTFSKNFLSSHQTVSPSPGRKNPSWARRAQDGAPPIFKSGSLPSLSSFSAMAPSPPTGFSAMRDARAIASIFEDDDSEALSDTDDKRFIPSMQPRGRSDGAELTRSRSQSFETRPGLLPSAEDLADDPNLLSLGKDVPGPVSSSSGLPPMLPIYAPLSSSPERFTPSQNPNLIIPGRQTLGEASDGGLLSGGSPSLGHHEEASQRQRTWTARFVPGQGIKYSLQLDAGFAAHSPISPRTAPSQHQQPHHESHALLPTPIKRRASDPLSQLLQHRQSINDLSKGAYEPSSCPLYIVEFKAGRTDLFYATNSRLDIRAGDLVIVEANHYGKDLGKVVNDSIVTLADVEALQKQQSSHLWHPKAPTSPGEQAALSTGGRTINPKKIYSKARKQDVQLLAVKTQDEVKALQLCQDKVRQQELPMDVIDAEYQWDRRKLTFYYVADKRVEYQELEQELFRLYKTRIWMARLHGPAGFEQ